METTVYFNSRCSKCRTAQGILAEQGVDAEYVRYLEQPPTRAEIERLMGLLGIDEPRLMMRTGEPDYRELGLADADRDALIDAMTTHPILIERPIVVHGHRAVIARPPERVLELLNGNGDRGPDGKGAGAPTAATGPGSAQGSSQGSAQGSARRSAQ